jgi:hypothetical protein
MFPFSYVALLMGFFIGIGITAACIGLFSAALIIICICIGVIRIMPLFRFFHNVLCHLLPTQVDRIEENLKATYTVGGNTSLEEGQYIFMWHPHSVFVSSMFFHTSTKLTDWPSQLRNIKCVASNLVMWFPFMNEIFSELRIIPSDYYVMKGALEAGDSFSVSAGGMREMLYENTSLLSKRRGIFKMALETGTSLVPVISVDDNRLWNTVDMPGWIQDSLKPYDICLPIPTLKSVYKWLGILQNPLKDPIQSIIGKPILVEKIVVPTESDIAKLRTKYIDALQEMYKAETGNELIVQ